VATDALRIYLVRHGVTGWNRALRLQGHTDVPLNEEGLEQARRLGARLAAMNRPPQRVWSSDLMRAVQTAEAIAGPLNLPIQTTPLLRETMLGAWEGLTREEIEARGDAEHLDRWRLDPHKHRPPDGETLDSAWERMHRAMAQIRSEHPSGQVAVVGHGGSLRALLCEALDAPITSMRRLALENASLSIIEERGSGENRVGRVLLVNDTSHLL
jgi:broad specificity phosphatase PhoE